MAQSVKHLTLDFGSSHDLRGHEIEPRVGLHSQQGLRILSFPLLLPLPLLTRMHGKGWGAEGEKESQAGSMPSMEPDAGLDPMTLRS